MLAAQGDLETRHGVRLAPPAAVSETVVRAYWIPDAIIDPFRLVPDNASHAEHLNGSV